MGSDYGVLPLGDRPGFVCGPVHIGAFCFIGPHSVIEANTTLGKGCLVAAHSRVRGQFPDFSIIAGSPGQRVGDTRDGDEPYLERHPEWRARYDAWAGAESGLERSPR
jgi:acetyltransferase-like isoleucine patch superfamily enzyme